MALYTPFPNPPVGWTESDPTTGPQLDETLRALPYHRAAFALRRGASGTAQTLPAGAWTPITAATFNVVQGDTHGGLSGAEYTVPTGMGGLWQIAALLTLTALSDGAKLITAIAVNGSRVLLAGRGTAGATDTSGFGGAGIVSVAAGDVLSVQGFQNGANGALNNTEGYSHFSGFRLL